MRPLSALLGRRCRAVRRHRHESRIRDDLQPIAPGRIGEIAVAGNGVSRVYQGNARETATHFVDNPFGAGKLYLTGNLGRLLPDSNVEFLKRKDDQTVIDGRRVEPAEVENVMYRFPGIEVAVVKPLLDNRDYLYLVGYYRAKSAVNLDALRRFLSQYLPDFMISESFLELDALPKTPNGEIDRGRLPFVLKKEAS